MKIKFLLLIAIIFNAFADGKYAGEFFSSGVDARSLSLGNIVLTSFQTPSAAYFNPSFLPELTTSGVTLSHSERFEGTVQQEFAAYNTKYSGFDVGAALIWLNVDGITLTRLENEDEPVGPDNRILPDGTVSNNEFAFFLSVGKKYNEDLNYGASVKLLYKSFEEESATGLGFDLSAFYKLPYGIAAGASLQDVTTSALFWTTGTNEFVSPSLNLGAEYNGRLDYFLADYKILAGSKIRTENYQEYAFTSAGPLDLVLSAGMELSFKLLRVRGGYNTDDTWSAGGGVSFLNFIADYSFKPDFEDLGNTHKASLSYVWK